MAFIHITEESLKTTVFKSLKLFLQGFHVGSERKLAAIVEDQTISRIHALQVQHITHGDAEGGEFRFVQERHDHQRGPGIEVMPVAADAITAPAGIVILFEDGDLQSAPGEMGRGGQSANPRADNDDLLGLHDFPIRTGCAANFCGTVFKTGAENSAVNADQAIHKPACKLFRSGYSARRQ